MQASLSVKSHSSEYLYVAGAECSKTEIRGFETALIRSGFSFAGGGE